MESLKYTGLIGRMVRMERPATEEELKIPGHPPTTGLEGYIVTIVDSEHGVFLGTDEGMGFYVGEGQGWTFKITDLNFYNYVSVRPHKLDWE